MNADVIKISRVRAFGWHGVLASERENGQDFFVSLELETSFAECAAGDDLSKAVNYADVVARVLEIVGARPPFNLIETLAEKIAREILAAFPRVARVSVEVSKPSAPVPADFADISVRISRSR